MLPRSQSKNQFKARERQISLPTLFEGGDLDTNEWNTEKSFWSKVPSKIEHVSSGQLPEINNKLCHFKLGKQDLRNQTPETKCSKKFGKDIYDGQTSYHCLTMEKKIEPRLVETRYVENETFDEKRKHSNSDSLFITRNIGKMNNVEEWVKSQARIQHKEEHNRRPLPNISQTCNETSKDFESSFTELKCVQTKRQVAVGNTQQLGLGKMPEIHGKICCITETGHSKGVREEFDRCKSTAVVNLSQVSHKSQPTNNITKKRRHTTQCLRTDSPFPSPREADSQQRGSISEKGGRVITPRIKNNAKRELSAFSWPGSNSTIATNSNEVRKNCDRISEHKTIVRCHSTDL